MNKKNFRRYSIALIGYNVLVILWGAVVRSTGSGAGCGNHWPLCNGEIVPQVGAVETAIELFHRITSSLDGVLVIGLVLFAYKLYGKKHPVTRWAILALAFIVVEGLLGGLLVVREWVVDDASAIRALVVSIHLANTYILLLTLTVTAWLANLRHEVERRKAGGVAALLVVGMVLGIVLSALGAVTALGDTLFPPESLMGEIQKDLDPTSHFLIQLRVIHPVMAILTSGYLFFVVWYIRSKDLGPRVEKRGSFLQGAIFMQVLAGGFTILTLAPLFMQVFHLFLADVFWISLLLYSLEVLFAPVRKS